MDRDTILVGRSSCAPTPALRLLGGLRLAVGGVPVEISESTRRLLAHVALQRRPVRRSPLAATLWPDSGERRAAGNLRSAVWRLQSVAPQVLAVTPTTIGLGEGITVDVTEHIAWAARVLAGSATGHDLVVSADRLDGLDLLPGWRDDWALMERERVRQRTLHALETLTFRLSEMGLFGEAVDAALLAVTADPLRESAQRALITAHLAEGNVVEALRAFERYERLLDCELNVAPSPALRALRPAGTPAKVPPAPRPQRSSPALR